MGVINSKFKREVTQRKKEGHVKGNLNILEMVYFLSWVVSTRVFVIPVSRLLCEHEILNDAVILLCYC